MISRFKDSNPAPKEILQARGIGKTSSSKILKWAAELSANSNLITVTPL